MTKRTARKPAPRDPLAQHCIANAVLWTTSKFLGRGKYETQEFPTFGEAYADAAGDRRKIIYAIAGDGRQQCIDRQDMIDAGLIAA